MRTKRLIPWALCAAVVLPTGAFADVSFDIKGIDGELEKNVAIYLAAIPASDRRLTFRFQSRVKDEVEKAMQALGYFAPVIKYSIEDEKAKDDATVVLDITPGEPVRIKQVDIQLTGDALHDKAFAELLATAPKVGDVLNQGQYDSLKSAIQSLAVRRGYFDADYTLSRLEVAPGSMKPLSVSISTAVCATTSATFITTIARSMKIGSIPC